MPSTKNHVYYFYAFNIALLIVIIVIMTTEQLFECICLLSRMLHNLGSCVLLEGFTNFSVDPYYDPLSLVMIIIWRNGRFVPSTKNHVYYFYAFNIALLMVIIAITTTERLFECICLLSRMLQTSDRAFY